MRLIDLLRHNLNVVFSLTILTGCAGKNSIDSTMPSTAKEISDATNDFLLQVEYVRQLTEYADDDTQVALQTLRMSLQLSDTASSADALTAAKEKAQALQNKNVSLHLQITPTVKLRIVQGTTEVSSEADAVLKSIDPTLRQVEQAIQNSMRVSRELDRLTKLASELKSQREKILQLTKNNKDVISSLEILNAAEATAALTSGKASRFVLDLASAMETGALSKLSVAPVAPAPIAPTPTATTPSKPGAPPAKPYVPQPPKPTRPKPTEFQP